MLRNLLFLFAVAVVAITTHPARADIFTTSPDEPPLGAFAYTAVNNFQFTYPEVGSFTIDNSSVYDFSNTMAPPASGSETITFSGMFFSNDYAFGGLYSSESVPISISMNMDLTNVNGNTDTYSLQITAFNAAATQPEQAILQLDPTELAGDTGQTTITNLGGGNFQIHSFFDVFTEISLGGGPFEDAMGPVEFDLVPAPEPSSLVLLGLTIAGAAARLLRTRREPCPATL